MRLADVVKYVNLTYAGVMLGLAAYFIVLIKYGYTFLSPQGEVSVYQLFASSSLGPLTLGVVPLLLTVMIVLTVAIVILNMVYENSLKPRKREERRRKAEKAERKRRR
jgi:hypothetical protein